MIGHCQRFFFSFLLSFDVSSATNATFARRNNMPEVSSNILHSTYSSCGWCDTGSSTFDNCVLFIYWQFNETTLNSLRVHYERQFGMRINYANQRIMWWWNAIVIICNNKWMKQCDTERKKKLWIVWRRSLSMNYIEMHLIYLYVRYWFIFIGKKKNEKPNSIHLVVFVAVSVDLIGTNIPSVNCFHSNSHIHRGVKYKNDDTWRLQSHCVCARDTATQAKHHTKFVAPSMCR